FVRSLGLDFGVLGLELWLVLLLDRLLAFVFLRPCARLGGELHRHVAAFEARRLLDHELAFERLVLENAVQHDLTELGMRQLSTAEHDGALHLVSLREEAFDMPDLELEVMLLDLWSELDLFDFDDDLVLPLTL